MYNIYRDQKAKRQQQISDDFYTNFIQDVTSMMFTWDEKIYRPEMFDRMIRDCGMAALIKTETSDYTPVWFNPIDSGSGRYADGWFKDCVCFDFCGKQYNFKDWDSNPDILVFFNTFLRYPDVFVGKYATMLTDVDTSISNNVHFSRMHPFPVARDRKTKNRIDQCMKDVSTGSTSTVLMEGSLSDILENGDAIQTLNLTDVTKSEYIQHLSGLHDSLIARVFFLLGLGITDNGKRAQITIDELNKNDDASVAMALAWYNERKKAIDKAKEKGHELSFDFSDLWKSRIESLMASPEDLESIPEEESEEKESDDNDDSGSSESSVSE